MPNFKHVTPPSAKARARRSKNPRKSGRAPRKRFEPTKVEAEEGFTLTSAQEKAMGTLVSDATHNALGGGSRSGKTFLLLRAVLLRALRVPDTRHVIFRFTFSSIKRSVVLDTLPKLMKLCFPGLMEHCKLDKTDYYLTLPNKSEVWFAGLDDKDRTEKILGMEFSTIYFNESSQIPWASIITALTRLAQKNALKLKVYYDFNPPSKKHWTYQVFIEKRDPITRQPLLNEFNYSFYLINPLDNMANLSQEYIDILDSLPEKARNRFLFGRFADDDEGALWTENLLAQNRRLGQQGTIPDFLRVIVAVDPSGCSGPEDTRSDEIGIIVAALGTDSHGYILEDLSGRYSPEAWADVAAEAYARHKADLIVGEKNFGGDMVRACLHASNDQLPYKDVNASRGKVVRAEPISQLYEQNKVHHIGYFPELEDQLCGMTTAGYMGVKSPDRADGLVWALTELFPGIVSKEKPLNQRRGTINTVKRGSARYDVGRKTRR